MRHSFFLVCFFVAAAACADGPGPVGGHGTMRLGLDGGVHQALGTGMGLSYRFALHDFLDRQDKYPDDTELDLANIRLEYFRGTNKVYLDKAQLVRFVRLPPLTARWEELSWEVEAGVRTVREATCNHCGAGNLLAGLGGTVEPVTDLPIAAWILLEAELLGSPAFRGFFIKPSLGPKAGLRFRIRPWLNGMLYGMYRYQFAPEAPQILQATFEWRVALATDWALNLKVQKLSDGWEGFGGVFAYF